MREETDDFILQHGGDILTVTRWPDGDVVLAVCEFFTHHPNVTARTVLQPHEAKKLRKLLKPIKTKEI